MHFTLLALHLQLYLLLFFRQSLLLKLKTLHFTLILSHFVFHRLLFFLILQELFILIETKGISLPTHFICLLSQILSFTTSLIKISSQLLYQFTVSSIIHSCLQCLIFKH